METARTSGIVAHHERYGDVVRRDTLGWIIVVLNLLAALNATYFFLGRLGVGVVAWLMMNSCTPSIALFAAGFLARRRSLMVAASALMFRYGTLGLFVFGWDGYNIIPQVGHILMTVAVAYVLYGVFRERAWGELTTGALLGLAILVPYMVVQHWWFNANPWAMEVLFGSSGG